MHTPIHPGLLKNSALGLRVAPTLHLPSPVSAQATPAEVKLP